MHWLLLGLLVFAHAAGAGEFVGRVVKIQDGDSITVLVSRKQIKVRLTEIDAPERKQPFGTRSRQSLGELCGGQDARVVEQGKDRYGRTLGYLYLREGDMLNAELIRQGFAHAYTRFPFRYLVEFRRLEKEARGRGVGLWSSCPVS